MPLLRQTVEPNGVYRFVVGPGRYLITAAGAVVYVHVGVGDDLEADLTSACGGLI
jgi:hypothetical protein